MNDFFSTTSSLFNSSTHSVTTSLANTIPPIATSTTTTTTASNPFQQPTLPFAQQQTPLQFPQHPTTAPLSLSTFPFAGYGIDTQRHAMQILSAVGALSGYAPPNPMLPYIPPLPPAPPPFTLVPNAFPAQVPQVTTGRLSPSIKRPLDENSNTNTQPEEKIKRPCYDSSQNPPLRSHNFDDENIALVPSLIDANINTLKKY